ncbi:glycerate kinase [Schaalia turicensis]|uniref:glycerate kinase n=1 Tax=Schaalia turicensis TaxID=131111 RepID=UPI0021519A69|nr:glycerate kinase [Schaalia turicensis]
MLSAARGLTDPLACDPVPDLVGPSGFKINDGRVSGLPQGVFVGGDSLPKVEGRGDRFDPETEVRPAPGKPLAPAVGYPQHRVLEVFRIPFDGDAVAFRLVDEGDPRLLWACDENDLVDLVADAVGLANAVAGADWVFTGEGSVDSQTINGKTPAGVAAIASAAGVPVMIFAGRIKEGPEVLLDHGVSRIVKVGDPDEPLAEALRNGQKNLRAHDEAAGTRHEIRPLPSNGRPAPTS